jgi:hypothetical protein
MNLLEQALEAELPKLATDFFIVFARFECALKRSGHYAIGDDTKVDPNNCPRSNRKAAEEADQARRRISGVERHGRGEQYVGSVSRDPTS